MDQSKNHFLYDPSIKDLRLFENPDRWEITGFEAAEYIRKHVIISLENDVPPILDLFDNGSEHEGKGFFAMLRVIFPYLTWAGKLFSSKRSEAAKVGEFLKSHADKNYQKYGTLLYEMYRHGLMHNHFPNLEWEDGKLYSWKITLNPSGHIQEKSFQTQYTDTKNQLTIIEISICPRQLYQDIHGALDKYASDLEKGEWLNEFHQGFRSKS